MIIKTERLILRPWKKTDAKSLYEYAKDPRVGPLAGWPVHTSEDESAKVITDILSAPETYAVCLKDDNIAIGSVALKAPGQTYIKSNNETEIGCWIGVPFWGHGYIPEAVKALINRAFKDLNYKGVWYGYYDGNDKSKRCSQKCGFKYHHKEMNKECSLLNEIRDEHYTYLSKDEWVKNIKG
ncbi:MAG: GNAT family N-acetyltransferase [Thomasclavelia sp.]|jgi:ribosomal-protein-alanine N-acetyltransferase|nr:GNAT family N-acetyltransferase [Thomasclavelia sp.]